MTYLAAILGCHGVGKTTLAKNLSEQYGLKTYLEPINPFIGKNPFLSEIQYILDTIIMNESIKKDESYVISDRFGFLDALIYSEAFYKLGWIGKEQLKTIYDTVNLSDYKWIFPKAFICMTESKENIMNNIKKRNRDESFKETNDSLFGIIYDSYDKFSKNELELKDLRDDLKEGLLSTPKIVVKTYDNRDEIYQKISVTC